MRAMRRLAAICIAVFFIAAFSSSLLAEKNSASGTWKLNTAKSKFSPGPEPKSATLTLEVKDDSVKTSYEEIEANDSHVTYEYIATYDDGKDYPITGSGRSELLSGAETVGLRRSGSNSFGAQFKKSGQVVMTNRTVLSKDGKSLAITTNGADSKGQPIALMTVWDKQ